MLSAAKWKLGILSVRCVVRDDRWVIHENAFTLKSALLALPPPPSHKAIQGFVGGMQEIQRVKGASG
jgi:hypothetical protein